MIINHVMINNHVMISYIISTDKCNMMELRSIHNILLHSIFLNEKISIGLVYIKFY